MTNGGVLSVGSSIHHKREWLADSDQWRAVNLAGSAYLYMYGPVTNWERST